MPNAKKPLRKKAPARKAPAKKPPKKPPKKTPKKPAPDREELIPVFMPALVAQLQAAENAAGRPLEKREVLQLRDSAPCIMMERSVADGLSKSRGYDDVDPERVWEQWQQFRG